MLIPQIHIPKSSATALLSDSFFPSLVAYYIVHIKIWTMRTSMKHHYYVIYVLLLLPSLCFSEDDFTPSRATFYGSPDCYDNPIGACGFDDYGRTVNDGLVSGVSRLYKNGTGCGACYQVRCKCPLCTDQGAYVVVTDYGEGDGTDFILSSKAYAAMAQPNKDKELFAYGVVEVEYRRVPCWYGNSNIMYKVHERSKYPHYLAILFIFVSGKNDITAVELWREDYQEWVPMRKVFGAVWDMQNPPIGNIYIRFEVTRSYGVTWVQPNS